MRFEQALQAMREGKTIGKKDPISEEYLYCKFENNQISFRWDDEDYWFLATFDYDDLLAENWEVISDD